MVGIESVIESEPFQVLTHPTVASKPVKYSVIKFDIDRFGNRRPRWIVYIPDAGNESNAIRVARLLNEEYASALLRDKQREEATDSKEKHD